MGLEVHDEGRGISMEEILVTSDGIHLRPNATFPIAQLPTCR